MLFISPPKEAEHTMERLYSYAMLVGDHKLQGMGKRTFIQRQLLASVDVARSPHVRWATAQTQAVRLQTVQHSLTRH